MAKSTATSNIPPPNLCRFSNIAGHEPIIAYLRKSYAVGKLPQTILFDGPVGVGKSAMAYALAKFLFANGIEEGAAFESQARKVEVQPPIHPDLTLLVPSGAGGQIRVDDVRDAIDIAHQMPTEGFRRVIIIDPADRLNVSSSNSLLKLLEEPPTLLTIILATESIHAILPTIRSRSSRLRLHSLGSETVARFLECQHGADAKTARIAALFSDGCPGRAIDLLSGKAMSDRDAIVNEWSFFQSYGLQGLFRVAANLAEIGQPLETLLAAWMTWLRDGMVALMAPDRTDLLVNTDRLEELAEESRRLGPQVIARCLDHLADARADARRLVNRQLLFESLLLRLGPELKRIQ